MQNTFKRLALLVIALLSCLCVTLGLSACGDKEPETATYSVTVTTTATDLTLTTIKAQWLNADDSAASDEIALNSDGKASVELNKGDYTVTLKGVPAGYTFEKKSVSADNPDATIAIAKSQDDSTTTTFSIKVTMPTGESLPADAKVQLFKGETPVGTAAALNANGQATLTADNGEYSVILTGLPTYLTYPATTVKTDDKESAEIVVDYATLTYTINVEAEAGVSLDGVKAQLWSSATTPEKVAEGEIVDGVATIQAKAADYTVVLDGLASGAIYNEGAVSKTVTEVDISVSLNKINVTIVKNANVNALDLTSLTVKLMNGSVEVATATPTAAGLVTFTAAPGIYTVKVEGLTAEYSCSDVTVTTTNQDVEIVIVSIPNRTNEGSHDGYEPVNPSYEINATGVYSFYSLGYYYEDWYMNMCEDVDVKFTAPEDGLYTFVIKNATVSTEGESLVVLKDEKYNTSTFTYKIVMDADAEYTFTCSPANIDIPVIDQKYFFDFTATSEEVPVKGSLLNPYVFDFDLAKDEPYTANTNDAYFKLPSYVDGVFVIEVGQGVSVAQRFSTGAETLLSPSDLAAYVLDVMVGLPTHLRFTSTSGTISVTISNYEYKGEGCPEANSAIAVTLDTPAEFNFEGIPKKAFGFAYFKFECSQAGQYYISNVENLNELRVITELPTWGDPSGDVTVNGYQPLSGIVTLDATTYYFAIPNNSGVVSFSISKLEFGDNQTGDLLNPIVATEGAITVFDGTEQVNWAPDLFGQSYEFTLTKFYSYTATADNTFVIISDLATTIDDAEIALRGRTLSISYFGSEMHNVDEAYTSASYWRYGHNHNGDIVLNNNQKVFFCVTYSLSVAFADIPDSIGKVTFNFDTVVMQTASDGENTISDVSTDYSVKYYKYTPSSTGRLVITLGGVNGDAVIALTMYSDANGTIAIEDYKVIGFNTSSDPGLVSALTTYYISSEDVTSGTPVYFTFDYMSDSLTSFKFAVKVITPQTANNGQNTVTADTGDCLQIQTYAYTVAKTGYLSVTVPADSSIKSILTEKRSNVLDSLTKLDQTSSPVKLYIFMVGNTNTTFTITFNEIKSATVGEENTLGEATTTEQKAYFEFDYSESGSAYYTFAVKTANVTATIRDMSGEEISTLLLRSTGYSSSFAFYVEFKADSDTVADVKLSITKLEPTAATTGDNNLGTATNAEQIKLFKLEISSDSKGLYTFAVQGTGIESTIYLYKENYSPMVQYGGNAIAIKPYDVIAMTQNAIVVVTFSGSGSDGKLVITKVTGSTDITTDSDYTITGATENHQFKLLKFTAQEEATYAFSAETNENVAVIIKLYDESYNAITSNQVKLQANKYVYVVATYYLRPDKTAQDVKVKVEKKIVVTLDTPDESSWFYARIGNATTNPQTVTFTANIMYEGYAGYFSGSTFRIKFSNDNGTTDITDQIEVTAITITTEEGTEFEGDMENGFEMTNYYDFSSTCTIVMTYKLKTSGTNIDNLYVGLYCY